MLSFVRLAEILNINYPTHFYGFVTMFGTFTSFSKYQTLWTFMALDMMFSMQNGITEYTL